MSRRTLPSKFIVFRTRGKIFNPQDCHLVFNSNEIGQPEDPERIYEIERIYNDGPTKSSKLLGVLFDEYLSFDAHITTKEGLFCLFGIFVPISRHTPPPPIPKLIESPLRASKHLAVSQDISGPPPTPSPLHENPAYFSLHMYRWCVPLFKRANTQANQSMPAALQNLYFQQ